MAVQAVSAWRYPPPRVNGRPVVVIASATIEFSCDDTGATPSSRQPQELIAKTPGVERDAAPKMRATLKDTDATLPLGLHLKTPKGFRCDVSPKVRGEIRPVFPRNLIFSDTGKATVWVLVDSHGVPAQMGVIEASAPAFGYAALAACQCAEYTPALLKGKPTDAVLTLKLKFDRDSMMEEITRSNEMLHDNGAIPAKKVYDHPQTVVTPEVPFPISARMANLTEGSAFVTFLISPDGEVVNPNCFESTHPSFQYMAMQAASLLRFPPPKLNGKPVYVRMTMNIEFSTTDTGEKKTTVTFR
jgi:outer membrane biosynthesis protein TonB